MSFLFELLFSVFPAWFRPRRAPHVTLLLVAAHAVVFLLTLPAQESLTRQVMRARWEAVSRRMLELILDRRSGVDEEVRSSVEEADMWRPFPPPALSAAFDKVEDDQKSLKSRARWRWNRLYPHYRAARTAFQVPVQEAPSPWTRYLFTADAPLWPALPGHLFIHIGLWDLFTTLLFIGVVGSLLEDRLGARYLWVYLAGGLAGGISHFRFGSEAAGVCVFGDGAALS